MFDFIHFCRFPQVYAGSRKYVSHNFPIYLATCVRANSASSSVSFSGCTCTLPYGNILCIRRGEEKSCFAFRGEPGCFRLFYGLPWPTLISTAICGTRAIRIPGLEITAGQRTMSGMIVDLTGQTFILLVMLTGQISTVFKMK